MIRAVLFDLDGTLYDRDALVQALVDEQHAAFEVALAGISREHFVSRVLEMDDHGFGNKEDGYARIVDEWGFRPDLAAQLVAYFWANYDKFCELSADTATTLQTLRDCGKRLGVVTNGSTDRQRKKLAALGLLTSFDAILISESEGTRKPSPEIFHRALRQCGVEAGEAVFVGDNPEVDIEGARNAGLLPIWKHVPYWSLRTDNVPTVHTLNEILPICLGR